MSQLAALHCSQESLKVVLSKPQIAGSVKIEKSAGEGRCDVTGTSPEATNAFGTPPSGLPSVMST